MGKSQNSLFEIESLPVPNTDVAPVKTTLELKNRGKVFLIFFMSVMKAD